MELIIREKPKIILFGASLFLFPHPVKEISKLAREINVHVGYDGSHVLGLIAGGKFQNPLREGASVLIGSTHKTFFGPQGGIILADKEHGETMRARIHPAYVDNAHWNRIAALALSLAEMKVYGKEYAGQVIQNARVLAEALAENGLPVACPELGYTQSHQIFLDYNGHMQGRVVAKKLEEANIIVDCGVRIGVCEVTRRGMKASEMEKIAELVSRVIIGGEEPRRVRENSMKLADDFQNIEYCFR